MQAPWPVLDPAAVLSVLREGFPGLLLTFARSGGETRCSSPPARSCSSAVKVLVGSQPSRLPGRSAGAADLAVDDHLGERLLRCEKDRLENGSSPAGSSRRWRRYPAGSRPPREPVVVRVANIQHLGARSAPSRPGRGAIGLAALLHPTPAVGGEPPEAGSDPGARGVRPRLVCRCGRLDRPAGDGEFCVALRCALLRGPQRAVRRRGIVADSDPAAELAETEVKLALLPVLAG